MYTPIFKAKRLDSNIFVQGAYYEFLPNTPYPVVGKEQEREPLEYKHVIITTKSSDWGMPRELIAIEVDKNTLCVNTGHMDKNGLPIWEHDIVQYEDEQGSSLTGEVIWNHENACFEVWVKDGNFCQPFPLKNWKVLHSKYEE